MIDADLAEFVDDDGGIGQLRRAQPVIEQRRLAAAEETGQQRHGQALIGKGADRFASGELIGALSMAYSDATISGVAQPRHDALFDWLD